MNVALLPKLMSRIDRTGSCWLWRGAKTGGGYGAISFEGKEYATHRISYVMFYGRIPPGLSVLHKCDVRNCVHPMHLFAGTQAENLDDRNSKGRHNAPRGSRHWNYGNHPMRKITLEMAESMRADYATGMTQTQVAAKHGVSQSRVSSIVRGEAWVR